MSPFSLPAVSEPPKIALEGCPERPRRLPRALRELPKPLRSVPERPPEHSRNAFGASDVSNRAPASSTRSCRTSKSCLRRSPRRHFGSPKPPKIRPKTLKTDPETRFESAGQRSTNLPLIAGPQHQGAAVNRRRRRQSAAPWQACRTEYRFRQILSEVCDLHATPAPPHPLYQSELVDCGRLWSTFLPSGRPKRRLGAPETLPRRFPRRLLLSSGL